jgi:adenine-specific DNA-methyltransferase
MPRPPSKKPTPLKRSIVKRAPRAKSPALPVENYRHPEATSVLRPDVGTQAQFKKRKPPKTYRFDSSLSPSLEWDGQNSTRELGEWLINLIRDSKGFQNPSSLHEFKDAQGNIIASVRTVQEAADLLAKIARPFLNWAGKAERLSFDVPTLPLFVHERLSTKAILETLKGHKRDKQLSLFDLFGDAQHSIYDQVLQAYEHADGWTNRLILGDSMVVMNSLLQYEGLGGQVQMIYIDPPYGVKFGSNFQPFVRKRDVSHNDDEDMTREPEMVKAYRDTWELGLHSYLTYMRDRLMIARDLLTPSGSIFVQISDENVHHVRELMDGIFGAENFVAIITFKKTTGQTSKFLTGSCDYILWYAKDSERLKYREIFKPRTIGGEGADAYTSVMLTDGSIRTLQEEERLDPSELPKGSRVLRYQILQSQREGRPSGPGSAMYFEVEFDGRKYVPSGNRGWTTTQEGIEKLRAAGRLAVQGNSLSYIRFLEDFPAVPLNNLWDDTQSGSAMDKMYVVQTNLKVIMRCMLMTTDPGDLVIDPTCGSGSTAYVAEQWGRRWITADVSRVPLALARQRLLTATYPFYQLKDESRGPAAGFIYKRKQNNKGEEVGGIVPHVTLKSIANNEPPEEEVLVDRPEESNKITRVTGPFAFEATIPTPMDWEGNDEGGRAEVETYGSFVDRMLEVLRKSPVLHIGGGKTVTLYNIRPPAKTLSLSAEALVDASADGQTPSLMDLADEAEEKSGRALPLSRKPIAIVFGPENGSVSERLVYEAAREAHAKGYTYLYVIGFAIQPNARELIDKCESVVDIPATYIQATPDLMMGDLLKNMRSSQIFSVCGLPEIKLSAIKEQPADPKRYHVELLGLDVFDPATLETEHRGGNDVPAWFLDADYNGLCFHVSQAFFPRTAAWDALKRALKGTYEDSVWEHLAGTISEPFEAGEHGQIAVKVIDDRGNELLVVKSLKDVK